MANIDPFFSDDNAIVEVFRGAEAADAAGYVRLSRCHVCGNKQESSPSLPGFERKLGQLPHDLHCCLECQGETAEDYDGYQEFLDRKEAAEYDPADPYAEWLSTFNRGLKGVA